MSRNEHGVRKGSKQARPRLDLHSPNGKLLAAVGPGAGIAFVENYFPESGTDLLIATAYFSVRGYDFARKCIPEATRIHFLVGKRDGHLIQDAVIEEIRSELGKVHPESLYAAVEDIVERMRTDRFRIADARQMEKPFHCKFYIVHTNLAWHGSANFSANGLKEQSEQVQIVRDQVQVKRWTDWFYEIAETARDLRAELIEALEAWLRMNEPFDIYLKALLHLLDAPDLRRERSAFPPTYYQKRLAAWAVRQLDAYGGALLVLATGLGKTIVGAEVAGLLRATDEVGQIVLLAPRAVHHLWKTQLQGRGVVFDAFDTGILFRTETRKKAHQISRLTALLREADDRTLILIDEAHDYRNQLLAHRSGKGSRVIDRLARATSQEARIVLMTGSVYGTSIQNLDSLLYLLPHRNPERLDGLGPWVAGSYRQFNALPPVAILGYPHVLKMARQRGDVENGQPYVDFGSERHYLPTTLQTHLIAYDLPLEAEVAAAFEARCFDQARKMPTPGFSDEEGAITTMTDTVYNVTLEGWLSSPRELWRCIAENLNTEGLTRHPRLLDEESEETSSYVQQALWGRPAPEQRQKRRNADRASGYYSKLRLDVDSRRSRLESLQRQLGSLRERPDDKAQQLMDLLRQRSEEGPLKAVVFVERLVTARYLDQLLHNMMPSLRVACTVAPNGRLEAPTTRSDLLERFSPRSHGLPEDSPPFDVLLCTDADGVGVNLQDADTVINYDLTTGADRLVQRLGRILRATPERGRELHVYTFRPRCLEHLKRDGDIYRRIRDRYTRLFARHDKSSEILGSRILAADGHASTVRLDGEVDVAALLTAGDQLVAGGGRKSLAAHLCVLEGHRQQAASLPHTLHSARYHDNAEHRLVVLIRCRNRYRTLIVEPKSQRVLSEEPLAALNLLACPPGTPRTDALSIKVHEVLDVADRAVRQWCNRHGETLDDTERVAALYLLPRPSGAGLLRPN